MSRRNNFASQVMSVVLFIAGNINEHRYLSRKVNIPFQEEGTKKVAKMCKFEKIAYTL
jgi:uncharacterized membrane protein